MISISCKSRFAFGVVLITLCGTSASAKDNFRDSVAPILERRCLSCHNDTQRKGDFSLQAYPQVVDSGYLEPGDAAASHLVDLITPVDGKAQMPKDAEPLSAKEITTIKDWIDAGAKWPEGLKLSEPVVKDFDWWSYRPLERPSVPSTADTNWGRTPVDAFILAKLSEKGLSPSSEADRRTLIRRLTYDLIGLPPTPEEIDAFINDEDPKAYEHLVDRLLESPHYGERWARHWLDVVQYADTCGYDKDKLRPNAWPYRDYVIRSFNEDKPYARFVQEQIAGDVLFPGDPDGILGLGFIAAGPWDFIGHVEVPESKIDGMVARNLDRDDMVSNTLNTFCSVTVQCARCHNHKFDPITQDNYYGLQSIFAAVDRAERPYDVSPEMAAKRSKLEENLRKSKAKLVAVEREIKAAGGKEFADVERQIAELNGKQRVSKEPQFGYHSQIVASPDIEKWVAIDLGKASELGRIVLHPCHDEYAGIGAGFGFPVRYTVDVSADGKQWTTISDMTAADVPNPGIAPVEIEGIGTNVRHIRITATKLALRSNDYIFSLAEVEAFPTASTGESKNLARNARVTALDSIEAPIRWAKVNLTDGLWPKGGDPQAAAKLAAATAKRVELLAKIETPERMERREAAQQAIKSLEQELASLPRGNMVYAAATHFKPQGNFKPTKGELRPVHVLLRGNVQQPGEAAVPGVLPLSNNSHWQFDGELTEGQRRAELARWLTAKEHPLVWRSIVNRIWQHHFGQGIVATPNDFGRMGAEPTHPELLDWLAVEFRDGGQSMKQLHRLIVTSSVYRQASAHDPGKTEIDSSNQFLWRMNRRRLSAEEIRDSILAVSGALDKTLGGPGYYLFALEKTAHSPHYEYHKFDPSDPKSHRRSVYRFIVRSQPDPYMTTLDCADSSQSTPKRIETLTSLQALSLLNNSFNLYMAERFTERLVREAGDLNEQVERAMRLIAGRAPTKQEQKVLVEYAEAHGTRNLCRMMFNLSEFVYLD